MKLSRQSLKKSQDKLDHDAAAFVEGADDTTLVTNPVGRPKTNRELTKPVSVSLTESDKKLLDHQFKRFNMIAYQKNNETTASLTRSDIVKLMAVYLDNLDDDELFNTINKLLT